MRVRHSFPIRATSWSARRVLRAIKCTPFPDRRPRSRHSRLPDFRPIGFCFSAFCRRKRRPAPTPSRKLPRPGYARLLRERAAARRHPRRARRQAWRREAAVAREISKLHEECVTGSLAELAQRYADAAPKGEIVIVVGPPPEPPRPPTTTRRGARRGAGPTVAVPRGGRSRGAFGHPAQARLCPRPRAQQMNRPSGPRSGAEAPKHRLLVFALPRLDDPRAPRARSRRRSRYRRSARSHPGLHRGQGAGQRRRRRLRAGRLSAAPGRRRRRTARAALPQGRRRPSYRRLVRRPGRWPRHLANVWQGR